MGPADTDARIAIGPADMRTDAVPHPREVDILHNTSGRPLQKQFFITQKRRLSAAPKCALPFPATRRLPW